MVFVAVAVNSESQYKTKLFPNHFYGLVTPKWVRAWDFLTHGHAVRGVRGSNPGRDTIAGGVFHPTRQLAKFSPPNMPYIVNSEFI